MKTTNRVLVSGAVIASMCALGYSAQAEEPSVATPQGGSQAASGPSGDCEFGSWSSAIVNKQVRSDATQLVIEMTNTTGTACTVNGNPTTEMVGYGDGSQIGAESGPSPEPTPTPTTISPGSTGHFIVTIATVDTYPADQCMPLPVDGVRIYMPGSSEANYVADPTLQACSNPAIQHMWTSPVGV